MALKKDIKESEARILVYLSQVPKDLKRLEYISLKLNMSYSYCIRVLWSMVQKEWLFKHKYQRYMFYDLLPEAPVEEARKTLCPDTLKEILQMVLDHKPSKHERVPKEIPGSA